MAGNSEKREEEKSFVVRDRRFSARKEEEEPAVKEEPGKEQPPRKEPSDRERPLPEISFPSFILSLSTSALIQLGEVPDPATNEAAKNLPLAKQTIDLIGMLKEKTKGNVSSDEEKLMEHILYDLRMRYVKALG